MTVTVVPVAETEFRETVAGLLSMLLVCDSMAAPWPLLLSPPDCADFGADADVEVEVDAPFSPEEPPGSWQDARVAATPMALIAARIRFEAVIMMEPPLLSIRPRRPEEYRDSMQHPSFDKWGDSHGEKLCRTHDAHGYSRGPACSPCSNGEYLGSDGEYPGSPTC